MALNVPQYTPPEYPDLSQTAYLNSIGKKDNSWNRFWSASGANYDDWRTDQLNKHQQALNTYNENFANNLNSYGTQMAMLESAGLSPYLANQQNFSSNPSSPSFGQYQSRAERSMQGANTFFDSLSKLFSFVQMVQQLRSGEAQIEGQLLENSGRSIQNDWLQKEVGFKNESFANSLFRDYINTYGPEYVGEFKPFNAPNHMQGDRNIFWETFDPSAAPWFVLQSSQAQQRLGSAANSYANAGSTNYKTLEILPLIKAGYESVNAVKDLDAKRAAKLSEYIDDYVTNIVSGWNLEAANNELQKQLLEFKNGSEIANSIMPWLISIGRLLISGK